MALPNGSNPVVDGVWFRPLTVVPAAIVTPVTAAQSVTLQAQKIPATAKSVIVTTVVNNANDWITLPPLADVPNGHTMTILCSAGGNFEMRTPASSSNKINNIDCSDGATEYLCTDTEVITAVKISTTVGWMVYSYTAIGAKTTAVVPD